MNFCACIDTLYTEIPWNERFIAAKRDGFESVEFWDWRIRNLEETKNAANVAGIKISGFNGDADYSMVDPHHREKYLEYLEESLTAAKKIGASSVTIHSNALGENGIVVNHYNELSSTVKLCSMYATLIASASLAEKYCININLEALNIKCDHIGNFLINTQMAAEIVQLIGSPRLKVLYDIYHMQLNEGDICGTLRKYINYIGHVHVADTPGRHEPGTGEINYKYVFSELKKLNYPYRIGFELFPSENSEKAVETIKSYYL